MERGAKKVFLLATHGVNCGPAVERLDAAPVEEILLSDSIPSTKETRPKKAHIVSLANMLAMAIERIHNSESVSMLFAD